MTSYHKLSGGNEFANRKLVKIDILHKFVTQTVQKLLISYIS